MFSKSIPYLWYFFLRKVFIQIYLSKFNPPLSGKAPAMLLRYALPTQARKFMNLFFNKKISGHFF
jgi:hypothetical protein